MSPGNLEAREKTSGELDEVFSLVSMNVGNK